MEVYTTIFMIFVCHALSTFNQAFSSRKNDGRHISQPKIRRMGHNNDECNGWDCALDHIMQFVDGNRDKIANGDSGRTYHHQVNKIISALIPDIKSLKEYMHLFDSFATSYENNHLRWNREKKPSDTYNVLQSIITTEHSFLSPTDNSKIYLKESNNDNINIPLIQSSATEAWFSTAKHKSVTVKPWNKVCSNCDTPKYFKDNCTKNYWTCHTKHKRTKKPRFIDWNGTSVLDQLLYYSDKINLQNPTTKRSKKNINCENNVLSPCLNLERSNHVENIFIKRPRRKNIHYPTSKGTLGIFKSAPKRFMKRTKFTGDTTKNVLPNKLLSRIKKLKRSLEPVKNEKKSDSTELISIGRRCKIDKLDRGIPFCQKSCSYKLPGLVNARTIKPFGYFKQQPSLLLCCHDEVNSSSSSSASSFNDLGTTTGALNTTLTASDLGLPDNTPITDDLTATSDWLFEKNGSLTDSGSFSPDGSNDVDTITQITSAPDTNFTILQMLMQVRNMPSKKVAVTRKPGDKFDLNAVLNNKDDLMKLSGDKLESIPKHYLISPGMNRQPRVSLCLGRNISTNEDSKEGFECKFMERSGQSNPVSTLNSQNPGLHFTNKRIDGEKDFEDLHTIQTSKSLVFIRVPIAGAEEHDRNGNWNLSLPSNSTSNIRNIKHRSILSLFMPSSLKISTKRPQKPWEEPWNFRQQKFNLFTTSNFLTHFPGKYNPNTTTTEPLVISKSLLEYIARTCPCCSKNRMGATFKTTEKQYDEIETYPRASCEDTGSESSTCNGLTKEKTVLKISECDLIKVTSPVSKNTESLKGLKILHSNDSPPKYFIEVPDLSAQLNNINFDARSSSLPSVSLEKKSKLKHETLRKKPIVLYLQPFQINGNDVYLQMSDLENPVKSKSLAPDYTKQSYDSTEQTSSPPTKSIINGFIGNNDLVSPFVLIPAYLAMHLHTPHHQFQLNGATSPSNINGYWKPMLSSIPQIGDQNVELPPLPNNTLEKKSDKPPSYTVPLKENAVDWIGLTKKSNRKPSSSRRYDASTKPSLIIFMDEMIDHLNKDDFSHLNQKGPVTMRPLEDKIPYLVT